MKIQFDINSEKLAQLEDLMKVCDFTTMDELFNNAVTLFEWAVKQKQDGRSICSVDETNMKIREVSIPALEVVKKNTN